MQIWIVDFGSQYTQLITRRCRELGYSSQIFTFEEVIDQFEKKIKPNAMILSGGPQSVFNSKTPYEKLFKNKKLPILGICYGMQIMGKVLGGKVARGFQGEYGLVKVNVNTKIKTKDKKKIFSFSSILSWMSHFDHVEIPPKNFETLFSSQNGMIAGMISKNSPWMGLQFHPEVNHTQKGPEILEYFLKKVAKLKKDWGNNEILKESLDLVKVAKKDYVLCAFSGGVDSLVAATIAEKVLGKKLFCFFVDHGLLRIQDLKQIELLQKKTKLNIEVINAKEIFFNKLKGVKDPEEKRKIIGKTFIEVFETKVHEFEKNRGIKFSYLLQGTLYPDVIESISPHKKNGKSVTIKSHHNVGGLPERMNLKLLEPLRWLFKDEVRTLGRNLALNEEWIMRHPFPGPGLGVRILGEIDQIKIERLQKADQILFEELVNEHYYDNTWQAFTVYLPIKTVGVKGDARSYEEVIALRMVNSVDGMTANVTDLPISFLTKVASRITNEVSGISRVVYDLTSKPPGTIEWE